MVGVIASVAVLGLVLVICAAEPLYILLGETLSLLKNGKLEWHLDWVK